MILVDTVNFSNQMLCNIANRQTERMIKRSFYSYLQTTISELPYDEVTKSDEGLYKYTFNFMLFSPSLKKNNRLHVSTMVKYLIVQEKVVIIFNLMLHWQKYVCDILK